MYRALLSLVKGSRHAKSKELRHGTEMANVLHRKTEVSCGALGKGFEDAGSIESKTFGRSDYSGG